MFIQLYFFGECIIITVIYIAVDLFVYPITDDKFLFLNGLDSTIWMG
jgi:hypothetical protein